MELRAQLNTAETLLDEGAADAALRILRSAWEPELPADRLAPLYCLWVRALCEAEDFEHAATLATRMADEFSYDADVLIAAGNVRDLRGELDLARAAFEGAIEVEPDGALQHYNLGAVLDRMGDESGAERAYRTAITVDEEFPTLFEATAALGALLRRQNRLEDAVEIYEDYLETDPLNIEILIEYGISLSDLDRFDDACSRFRLVLSFEPEHPGALYNLAITLYRMGNQPDAIVVMEQAHAADPGTPLTLAVLGEWYLASPKVDLDEALSLLYGAVNRLLELDDHEGVGLGYASLVVEEVFEALWHHGRQAEAREVARLAGQRDWITTHMLETLNEADHGADPEIDGQVTAYMVMARAEAGETPEHWPADARGYTTGFTVLATDEDEARAFTLEYLRAVENHPAIRFHLDVVRAAPTASSKTFADETVMPGPSVQPRARGVVQVASSRAYFRSSGGSSRTI